MPGVNDGSEKEDKPDADEKGGTASSSAGFKLLSAGEKYGYQLAETLAQQSGGVLKLGQSTLYPMLYNLEAKGLISSRRGQSGAPAPNGNGNGNGGSRNGVPKHGPKVAVAEERITSADLDVSLEVLA